MGDLNTRAGKALAGRWRAGMLATDNGRVRGVADGRIEWDYRDDSGTDHFRQRIVDVRVSPDMADPATRGAFLDVVREAWGDPTVEIRWSAQWSGWYAYGSGDQLTRGDHIPLGRYATEGEALVAALEAAPPKD